MMLIANVMIWPATVAMAAPFTPSPSGKINTGSRIRFARASASVHIMAYRGDPSARIAPLSPYSVSSGSPPNKARI